MVKVFASPTSWIEGAAIQQLEQTAALEGVHTVVGMPDLHPGKGCAVGAVTYSEGIVYPHLVGNDIGCGYTLIQTSISKSKVKLDRLADRISGMDDPWDDAEKLEEIMDVSDTPLSPLMLRKHPTIGTIGGGNHFAELQKIERLDSAFAVDDSKLVLLVHSGSRSLGESIFQKYAAFCGNKGFAVGSEHFNSYMLAHEEAMRFAYVNRLIIALRLLECLGAQGETILDLPHNFVEPYKNGFLHRKGAAPADRGFSPLPGSRGTPSYILSPLEDAGNLSSLAHGAGRKSSRANMHGRVTETVQQMTTTPLGGVVVCGQEALMREEHHSAYKNVEQVLADITENKLATEVAMMVPVLTYKSERIHEDRHSKRDKEDDWRRERRKANRK
jgi:release factor H-coupled RctB family protein